MEILHIKLLPIKRFALLAFLMLSTQTFAQTANFLVPDGAVAQYAGSIGYGSAGISYDLFRKKNGNLDFLFGFVPKSQGGPLRIISTKLSYKPFKIRVRDFADVYVANPGAFVSYHTGEQFGKWDEDQYPKGYYWWSKSVRVHLSLSTEVKLNAKKIWKKGGIKAVGLYSELNTNELYTVSWFKNQDTMSLLDIVRAGYGVRIYF